MVRRSVDGSLLRVATRASRLSALRWALLMSAVALWLAMGFFKALVVAVPVSVLVLVAMAWWICVIGRPVLECNPHGIVVRNLFRSWRIPWRDISWIGEGWTIDRQGGGWAIIICSCTPLSGVRPEDVPMEEKIRRKHGELPRNVIACRATRPARRRPSEIVEAIRTVANEHAVPVRFADPVGHENRRTGSRNEMRYKNARPIARRRVPAPSQSPARH